MLPVASNIHRLVISQGKVSVPILFPLSSVDHVLFFISIKHQLLHSFRTVIILLFTVFEKCIAPLCVCVCVCICVCMYVCVYVCV